MIIRRCGKCNGASLCHSGAVGDDIAVIIPGGNAAVLCLPDRDSVIIYRIHLETNVPGYIFDGHRVAAVVVFGVG